MLCSLGAENGGETIAGKGGSRGQEGGRVRETKKNNTDERKREKKRGKKKSGKKFQDTSPRILRVKQ